MTDLDKLDALAAAATPGPREADMAKNGHWDVVIPGEPKSEDRETWLATLRGPNREADAAFIAACDPATIRDLVAAARSVDVALDSIIRMAETAFSKRDNGPQLADNEWSWSAWDVVLERANKARAALHRKDDLEIVERPPAPPEPTPGLREAAVTSLAIHLHRKGVGCDGHRGDDRPVADVMHRDDAYDIYDHLAALATPAPEPPRCEHGAIREPCVPCSEYAPPAPDRAGLREDFDELARLVRQYVSLAGRGHDEQVIITALDAFRAALHSKDGAL